MRLVLVFGNFSNAEVAYDVHDRMRFRVEADGGVRVLERGPLGLWWTTIAYHPPSDRWTSIRVER